MTDRSPKEEREEFVLPAGHYYWDGRSLRRTDSTGADEPAHDADVADARERTHVGAAVETLLLCGGCSVVIGLLTVPWDTGALAGLAHAFVLLPVLLIDPVYRRVTEGQLDTRRMVEMVWRTSQRSREARALQPWWLRTIFSVGVVILLLELAGVVPFAAIKPNERSGQTIVLFWLVALLMGLVTGLSPRGRLAVIIAVAAATLSVLGLLDPFLGHVVPHGGLLYPGGDYGPVGNALTNAAVGLILAPVPIALAVASYGLGRLIRRLLSMRGRRPGVAQPQ